MLKVKKVLKERKGTAIIEFVIIVMVVAIISIDLVPDFSVAFSNRQQVISEQYSGTDTIVEID